VISPTPQAIRTRGRNLYPKRKQQPGIIGEPMDHESLLVFLPDSQEDAKSMKEIAQDMGLDISTYAD
jgi:hypothetical protein